MTPSPQTLLIVDADEASAALLVAEARGRQYDARAVHTIDRALQCIEHDAFDVILVDMTPGAEAAFTLLGRLRELSADTQVVVMTNRTSVAATIQWFDPDAFAFVRKSDVVQVFASVARALERRRITAQNRRLVWELQTINEIATGISQSLELEEVLTGALQRLVNALAARGGSIRLRNDATGTFETAAVVGPPPVAQMLRGEWPGVPRPSDGVIASRAPVIVEDFGVVSGAAETLLLRSAISVPLLAGAELLGTLSLGCRRPRRFQPADQQLLATIARQIVVAIQNARLHQSVRRAKVEWEQTFDAISDPIAVFNDRGELLRGNRALAGHLGLPVTDLPQRTCAEVGACGGGEGRSHDAACAVSLAVRGHASQHELTLADGRIFSVTTFPIGVPSAGPSVVQVCKNVTEEILGARRLRQMSTDLSAANAQLVAAMEQLKATQAQLLQSEKLSAIGQLVAGVAHELNNPLTSVIGYAQLVEDEVNALSFPGAASIAQDLHRISQESERAARIVRNLLAFARRQAVERAPQDVPEVCHKVLALREYEFRVTGTELVTDLPGDLPRVLADGGQLQQLLLNLVLNAEHAMRGRPVRRLSIAASYNAASASVDLTVSDTGHGIDAATLPRIFDPFFTTREVGQGTGLGLSICYGIVRDHGGEIAVESTPGVSTTFRVTLPAHVMTEEPDREVLVAHPAQADREFIAAALRGWGYAPVAAATAADAIRAAARPSLHAALVESSVLAEDLPAWRRAAAARPLDIVVLDPSGDEAAVGRFGNEQGAAAVGRPFTLRALHGAVGARTKEYV